MASSSSGNLPWDHGLNPSVLEDSNCRVLVNDALGFDNTLALGTASTEAMQLASVLSRVINFELAVHASAQGKFQHVDTRVDACMHEIHAQQGVMQGVTEAAKAELVALQGKFEQDMGVQKGQVQAKVSQIEDALNKVNQQLQHAEGKGIEMDRQFNVIQVNAQEVNDKVEALTVQLNQEWGKMQADFRLKALEDKVSQLLQSSGSASAGVGSHGAAGVNSSGGGSKRGAMEHRAVMNLKVQGSDRMGYRMWHEKLVNAFAQVNNQYRVVLERVTESVDQAVDMGYSGSGEWGQWLSEWSKKEGGTVRLDNIDMGQLNEDMYSVLMDKTEGDAWLRVKAVKSGRGLEAFVRIYKWFAGTSGMGLSERARVIMAPTAPKSEGDMAESVDKWLEGLRLLQSHKGYRMSIQLRVTALKMLMIGRAKDQFESWEQDMPKNMDNDADEDKAWNELLGKVQDYATRRRLEANMKGKG